MSRIERLAAALAGREPHTVQDPERKLAAVAIILAPDPDAVLLIRRADREGDRWSGQMAFPGGRWSEGDPDLLTTAARETREEVGVDLTGARLLGRLDDSAPRSQVLPPIIVTPYVFAVDRQTPLVPNHEVAGAFWTPIERLADPDILRPYPFDIRGARLNFPGYHLDEGVVWGMTERILTPLLRIMG